MTAYELMSVSMEATARLDMSWALFLSVHAAIFGGIVYIDRPLRLAEKIVLIPAYFAIAGYNYYLTRTSQKLLGGLYQDISELKASQNLVLNVVEYFEQMSLSAWSVAGETSVIAIHAIAMTLVIAAVILDKPLKKKRK